MSVPAFAFTDRWRPFVRVGIGDTRTPAGAATWGSSQWGTAGATWNGGEPVWADLSCEVRSVDWDFGRDWALDRFTPGSAVVTAANATGWATDSSDPAVELRPGRHLQVGVVDAATGAELSLWRGFIDSIVPMFDPIDGDSVQIMAFDALGEVGLHERGVFDPPVVGAGERGDARFRRILAYVGWPDRWVGAVDASAVTLEGRPFDVPFAEELGITADSEGGGILCDLLGRLVFRARDWLTWPAGGTPTWRIGNSGADGEVCPSAFELSDDRSDIANQIAYATVGGLVASIKSDPASQSLYGVIPSKRDDLICTDPGQLEVLATRALRVRSPGGDRVRAVTLDAATDPDAIVPMLLAADVSASPPIRAELVLELGGADRIRETGVLMRVSHSWRAPYGWTCRLGFDRADPFTVPAARWNEGRWADALWATAVREGVAA